MKRIIMANLVDLLFVSLERGSARRKTSNYTEQHKHRAVAGVIPCIERNWNSRSHSSSPRRRYAPQTMLSILQALLYSYKQVVLELTMMFAQLVKKLRLLWNSERFIVVFIISRTDNAPKSVLHNTHVYDIHTLYIASNPNAIRLQLNDGGLSEEFLLILGLL